jgi:hypothetical protein
MLRLLILVLALALVSCKSSRPSQQGAAVPVQPGAPAQPGAPQPGAPPGPAPAGISLGGGSSQGAEMTGTAGPRQGNEVVVTTTSTTLPPVGAQGTLFWVVDRPIPVFGQGVNLSLANVAVKQVQPGSVTLTIVSESGPVSVNGQRVNVFQPNIAVKLTY